MVRNISVRLLHSEDNVLKDVLSSELVEFAAREFPALMAHPDFRQDCLQELRLVEIAEELSELESKAVTARRALAWLSFELGLEAARPAFPKPQYLWCRVAMSGTRLHLVDDSLPALEEGSFIDDLSAMVEVARAHERSAA